MEQRAEPVRLPEGRLGAAHAAATRSAPSVFWAGIREYYRRYRDGNASTDDLRQVMEQLSHKPCWFFAQWLRRPGVPRIEGTWRYDAARKVVEITVTQTQGGDPFRFPLEVRVAGAAGDTPVTARLSVDSATATGTVAVPFIPSAVTFDPSTALLADIGPVRPR